MLDDDEILSAVRELHEESGYFPTFREVGERVGLSSPDSVYRRLLWLRLKGKVIWEDGKPRTLRVIDQESGQTDE